MTCSSWIDWLALASGNSRQDGRDDPAANPPWASNQRRLSWTRSTTCPNDGRSPQTKVAACWSAWLKARLASAGSTIRKRETGSLPASVERNGH